MSLQALISRAVAFPPIECTHRPLVARAVVPMSERPSAPPGRQQRAPHKIPLRLRCQQHRSESIRCQPDSMKVALKAIIMAAKRIRNHHGRTAPVIKA